MEIGELPHFSLLFSPFHSLHMLLLLTQQRNKPPRELHPPAHKQSQSFAGNRVGHKFTMSPGAPREDSKHGDTVPGTAEELSPWEPAPCPPMPVAPWLRSGKGRKQEKKALEYHKRAMGFHYSTLEVPAFKKKKASNSYLLNNSREETQQVSSSSLVHNICLRSSC